MTLKLQLAPSNPLETKAEWGAQLLEELPDYFGDDLSGSEVAHSGGDESEGEAREDGRAALLNRRKIWAMAKDGRLWDMGQRGGLSLAWLRRAARGDFLL